MTSSVWPIQSDATRADSAAKTPSADAEGRIRLDDLVSERLPISEWRTAFQMCMDKTALKVVLYPI